MEKKIGKKTGRGGTENFPSARLKSTPPDDVSMCLKNVLVFSKQPLVKSDEECRERLAQFFETCAETGQLPTVEKMCLALGTVRQVVWEWENGVKCSSERADLIKKGKEIIASFEAELAAKGKVNPVVYIFRAKNYFGMKDQQDVVVAPAQPLGADVPTEQLAEKYAKALPSDDS